MHQSPIQIVEQGSVRALESLGTKEKKWFVKDQQIWLFKRNAKNSGEDWAEVISSRLCTLLGIPHVEYSLADFRTTNGELQRGAICPRMALQSDESLVLGNQLLLRSDSAYPEKGLRVRKHTLAAIQAAVLKLEPPVESVQLDNFQGIVTAQDYFVGYMMLDAWIANQDRHHENWAAIESAESGRLTLTPTFDHGAALARNLSDAERCKRITSTDLGYHIQRFCEKARGQIFGDEADTKGLPLLQAFQQFSAGRQSAVIAWLKRLAGLDFLQVQAIVEDIPESRMSPACKEFTTKMLEINRQRLLNS